MMPPSISTPAKRSGGRLGGGASAALFWMRVVWMICRSLSRFESPSRSIGMNQPDSSSDRMRMDVAPCVTAVENDEPPFVGLYCPV